jgi:hypothetical protein
MANEAVGVIFYLYIPLQGPWKLSLFDLKKILLNYIFVNAIFGGDYKPIKRIKGKVFSFP